MFFYEIVKAILRLFGPFGNDLGDTREEIQYAKLKQAIRDVIRTRSNIDVGVHGKAMDYPLSDIIDMINTHSPVFKMEKVGNMKHLRSLNSFQQSVMYRGNELVFLRVKYYDSINKNAPYGIWELVNE